MRSPTVEREPHGGPLRRWITNGESVGDLRPSMQAVLKECRGRTDLHWGIAAFNRKLPFGHFRELRKIEDWVPLADAKDYVAMSSGPKTTEFYDADHALNARARMDCDGFLRKTLN